jgi:hypothetical protein
MTTNRRALVLVIVMELCIIPTALMGADPAVIQPPPGTAHHFWDARNISVFSINAMIMAADIATTRRALQAPGAHEANPLMRNQGAAVAMKAATVCGGIGIAYMLHKSGHHKAERFVPLFMGVPSAVASVHNAGIHP